MQPSEPTIPEPVHAQALGSVPAAETFAIARPLPGSSGTDVMQQVPTHLRDASGAYPAGLLFLLADHTLGAAIFGHLRLDQRLITSHLHIEVLGDADPAVDKLAGSSLEVHMVPGSAFARGRAVAHRAGEHDGDTVALFSTRFAIFGEDQQQGGRVTSEARARPEDAGPAVHGPGDRDHPLVRSPIHTLLRTGVVPAHRNSAQVTCTVEARPEFANERGGLHGGAGALIAERVGDIALRMRIEGDQRYRPVELRAVFLRPIPADGTLLVARAEVGFLGRSSAVTSSVLLRSDGKVAVQVDAIHAAVV